MSEKEFQKDREHGYKCGNGISPTALKGINASNSSLLGQPTVTCNTATDKKDWA